MEEVIIELRGHGVILRLFHLNHDLMEILNEKAAAFGEPLNQAWFDPFFWHPKEMSELRKQINPYSEYRGLMNDSRSFIEIRRKGKRRKQYTVAQLIGEGQLFPMVDISTANWHLRFHQIVFLEFTSVTGCPAQYSHSNWETFGLSNLKFIRDSGVVGETIMTSMNNPELPFVSDDYVLRSQQLIIKTPLND